MSTPGFKRQINFNDVLSGIESVSSSDSLSVRTDLSQGQLKSTGGPLDLAITGDGLFRLRSGEHIIYSRQGQFKLAQDGTVVTPQGHVLQQAGGGDLVLERAAVEILEDGTVVDEGRPVARIALFAPAAGTAMTPLGGSLFSAAEDLMEEAPGGVVRQGMVESSNVMAGDEMVTMMAAVRQAETGARLVQIYDDLLGRAITTFGQGGK
jgi:flagellar basal-body rod protein FlgG